MWLWFTDLDGVELHVLLHVQHSLRDADRDGVQHHVHTRFRAEASSHLKHNILAQTQRKSCVFTVQGVVYNLSTVWQIHTLAAVTMLVESRLDCKSFSCIFVSNTPLSRKKLLKLLIIIRRRRQKTGQYSELVALLQNIISRWVHTVLWKVVHYLKVSKFVKFK